jgi:hypothetical protein
VAIQSCGLPAISTTPRISGERSVLQRKKFHLKRLHGHESS